MDIERLIIRLTRDILSHLQAAERSENLMFFDLRRECEQLRLPAEMHGQHIFFLDDTPQPDAVNRRIMPRLTIDQQADLAIGRASDPQSRAVLQALLEGHQVEVLEYAYTDFASSAPPALFELYREQAEKLIEFGLIPYTSSRTSGPSASRKRLITEADIRRLLVEGNRSLKIDKTCRITPLALDLARDNKLCIEREER